MIETARVRGAVKGNLEVSSAEIEECHERSGLQFGPPATMIVSCDKPSLFERQTSTIMLTN